MRIHKHAAGIKTQSISKGSGWNSSKIHLTVDANENSIKLIIGDSTTHDVKAAIDLINHLNREKTEFLCADKVYDSESFI